MDVTEAPEQLTAFAAMAWTWALQFLPRLGAALIIVALGFLVAGWLARALNRMLLASHRIGYTVAPMLVATVRYAIFILIAVAALGQLGVQTTSLLAVLGAAGLAIGLALQGTLSNIAAGLMLLWLRPFDVRDSIEYSGGAGTVEELGLFATQLRTWDGVFKFVPNSQLWNATLTNYTRNPTRLVIIPFSIGHEHDIATARAALKAVAEAHRQVLKEPPPTVVPLSISDTTIVLQLRAWAATPFFGDVQWDLTEAGKKALDDAGITAPQRIVHLVSAAGEPGPTAPLKS